MIFNHLNGEHLLRGYLVNDPKPDLGNASVGTTFKRVLSNVLWIKPKNFFVIGGKV